MKKVFSTISELIFPKKRIDSKITEPTSQNTTEKIVRISEEFEINIKGIPTDLTVTEQRQIFVNLLKNGLNLSQDRAYQKGDDIFQGKATLNIKNRVHQLEYSISAMKVLQALSVYKDAFDYVNQGAESGKFDPELAEMAADFLKESAWKEVLGMPKPDQKSFATKYHLEKTKQISTPKPIIVKEKDKNGKE